MAARIPTRLSIAEGRRFGLTVGIGLAGLAAIAWWRGHAAAAPIIATTAGLLLIGGLLLPTHLGPVEHAWMGLARAISRGTAPLFLALAYFGVITPIGFVMRVVGASTLRAKPESESSYWQTREPGSRRRRDMERQF